MNSRWRSMAIPALRWTVGLVVLAESCRFVFSRSTAHHLGQMGLPQWLRPAIGGTEILAALLFLLPATIVVGGRLLLAIFAIAIAIHILLGEFDVSGFLVYTMAVIVCLAYTGKSATAPKVLHDR
ncbi:MAG TPA: DoxX family protein [Candidatus Acidoferrales bacterium]|nr:DoxX family protein [Candidatus Acidoferrales bacterium]